jgi:hypothetical protein
VTTPPYTSNEVRFIQAPGTADTFLVYLHHESAVHLAVVSHERPSWYIYRAVSGVQTLRPDCQEAVKFEVYAYALAHPSEVCDRLLAEATAESARTASQALLAETAAANSTPL